MEDFRDHRTWGPAISNPTEIEFPEDTKFFRSEKSHPTGKPVIAFIRGERMFHVLEPINKVNAELIKKRLYEKP